jgi:hypothetical protein
VEAAGQSTVIGGRLCGTGSVTGRSTLVHVTLQCGGGVWCFESRIGVIIGVAEARQHVTSEVQTDTISLPPVTFGTFAKGPFPWERSSRGNVPLGTFLPNCAWEPFSKNLLKQVS